MTDLQSTHYRSFGELLQSAIAERGLNVYRFAPLTGLDHSTLRRYISMERRPSRKAAIKLARALGLDDDDQQRLLLPLGYLTPTYVRRLRQEMWSDQ